MNYEEDGEEEDIIVIGKSKKRLNPAFNDPQVKRVQYQPPSKAKAKDVPSKVNEGSVLNAPLRSSSLEFTTSSKEGSESKMPKRTQKVQDFMDQEDRETELTRPDAAIRQEIADRNRLSNLNEDSDQISIEHDQEEHEKLFKGIDWPYIERDVVETALNNEAFVPFKEDIDKQRRYKLFINGSTVVGGVQKVKTSMITLMETYRNVLNYASKDINTELKEFEETVKAVSSIKPVALTSRFSKASAHFNHDVYTKTTGGITDVSEFARYHPKPKDTSDPVEVENQRREEKWQPDPLLLFLLGINEHVVMNQNVPVSEVSSTTGNRSESKGFREANVKVKRPIASDFF